MSSVKILHISDLHLGSNRPYFNLIDSEQQFLPIYNEDAFRALAETINELQEYIDGILLTGDISVTGSRTDLNIAISAILSQTEKGASRPSAMLSRGGSAINLTGSTKPIFILPGNHDRHCGIAGFPGALFYDFFSSHWHAGTGGVQSYLIPDDESPILAIVCADFSLKKIGDCSTLGGHWGQGKVYPEILQKLREETLQVRSDYTNCGVIWAIHFAPAYEKYNVLNREMTLIEAQSLLQEADRLGIGYILCGHTHKAASYADSPTNVHIQCAGTAACVGQKNETVIHLRDIIVENGIVTQMRSRAIPYDDQFKVFLP
jgi:DNA repair exonuclease SbcCD nuclease subunit